MEFAQTYRHEVIQSRRDRSRRARFWSRIVGIVLMLTIAAVLKMEPDLRRALSEAGTNAILQIASKPDPISPATATLSPASSSICPTVLSESFTKPCSSRQCSL